MTGDDSLFGIRQFGTCRHDESYFVERVKVVSLRNEISLGNLCENRMWLIARDRGISLNSQLLDESSRAPTQLQPFEYDALLFFLPASFVSPFLFGNWPETLLCGLRERDRDSFNKLLNTLV